MSRRPQYGRNATKLSRSPLESAVPRRLRSEQLDLHRVVAAAPRESSCHRKSAHPDDLGVAQRQRPTRALLGWNVLLGEQALQLLFRAAMHRVEAIARTPVADDQLWTEQLGTEQGIRWASLARELLGHRDRPQCQPQLRDVNLARNRQGVLVTGEWRFRPRGPQFQAPALAYCQPSSGKLRLRQLPEGTAQQLLDVLEVSRDLLAFKQSLQQTSLQCQRQLRKITKAQASRGAGRKSGSPAG